MAGWMDSEGLRWMVLVVVVGGLMVKVVVVVVVTGGERPAEECVIPSFCSSSRVLDIVFKDVQIVGKTE